MAESNPGKKRWRPGPSFLAILIALPIFFLIHALITRSRGEPPGELLSLALYLLLFTIAFAMINSRPAEASDLPEMPLSGPIGRYGAFGLTLLFMLTSQLSLLNPFQLWQQLKQIGGQLQISWRLRNGEPAADTYVQQARYTLPLAGEWFVANGGVTEATSHSWAILTQRYAYDFFQVDDDLRRHTGAGTALDDYYCYGAPIVAAAPGVVLAVRSGVRDAPLVGRGIADFLAQDFRGNFVVVQHAPQEYGFYAHLVPGSISVRPGEQVDRGQPLGRCGNSGHSTEPHLHFHIQDRADFFTAMGLPVRFDEVVVDGTPADGPVYISRGSRVATLPAEDTS